MDVIRRSDELMCKIMEIVEIDIEKYKHTRNPLYTTHEIG